MVELSSSWGRITMSYMILQEMETVNFLQCFTLRSIGLYRSSETLRREVVQYLNSNDLANGIPLVFLIEVP